jgi:hypothetical protein
LMRTGGRSFEREPLTISGGGDVRFPPIADTRVTAPHWPCQPTPVFGAGGSVSQMVGLLDARGSRYADAGCQHQRLRGRGMGYPHGNLGDGRTEPLKPRRLVFYFRHSLAAVVRRCCNAVG